LAGLLGAVELSAGRAAENGSGAAADGAKPAAVSYYRDVRPILQANCQGCHQPAKAGGSLELTAFKSLLNSGDSGSPAVVPGKPDESYVIEQITPVDGAAAMPQGKKPLADHEIALIRRWIEEGARDDTPPDAAQPIDAEHPPVYSGPPVITSIDWSPDGALLAVAGFHEVLLHKADGSGLVARLIGMSPRIESVRFSPDGSKLAVTGGRPAQMGEVQIWDVAERTLLLSVPITFDSVFGASWSPDGKRVAFGGTDKSVRVIDAETGEQVLFQTAHDDWVLGTAFSVDGGHLVSVGRDMTAKLIEVPTQRFVDNITSITPGALKGGIQSVVQHPLRDEILFGGSDGTPKIYRMHRTTARQIGDDANLLWELPSLPGRVFSVDITNDGRTIAAGSSLDGHGYVHVYRMEPVPTIPDAIQAILNKPTHTRSGDEKAQLQKHFEQGVQTAAKADIAEAGVYAVALSPDGTRVAAAGGEGTVRLFDTQTGSLVTSFMPVEVHVAAALRDAEASVRDSRLREDPSVGDTRLREEPPLPANYGVVRLLIEPAAIQLDGPARYAQLIVTAESASGARVDVTRRAKLTISEPLADVNATGLVTPSENGHAVMTATFGDKSASVDIQVSGLDVPAHPDFIRDIAPILARVGCNQGTCHGAQAGKNGFKLSLRGYDPLFDVRALADDLASRRVNVASPTQSLMLLKPTAAVPHQGGQVLTPGTPYYELLHAWISDGARLNLTAPRVTRLEIMPANPVVETLGATQQIRVVAFYSDGTERDVTREAFVESGNTDVVKAVADQPGLLEALRRGEAAALVRYEGNYAATTLTVMGDRSGFEWEDSPANNRIDELVAAKLERTKTAASPLTDDYEFVRRVYLDLTGLPPTPEQIHAFIDDARDTRTKRDALVSRLVGSNDYLEYWTNKWADLLMVNRKFLGLEGAVAMRKWIRGELASNTPYDEFVRKIITATGSTKDNPAGSYFKALRTPQALMENTTHLFLATRFNCNKCHDHPFERWTQDQYYELAAFFARVKLDKDPASGDAMVGGTAVEAGTPLYEIVADTADGEVKHDRTGAVTQPAFPFECEHKSKEGATRREQLAAWLTSPDNPYFARSYVNRIWGYLMGRGIVEPLDDIRAGNPPSNPELLEYLTTEFIESGFNTRHVFELICQSRTYQLSVKTNRWNEDDQINFSHARARRLPAEVLFDAIYRATGATSVFPGVAPGARAATLPDVGIDLPDGFLGNLGRPARESACECERSSNLQLGPVMALVSGPTVGDAISDPGNAVVGLVKDVADNGELVNRLFLRFLSRPGKTEEVSGATQMFEQVDADHARLVADLEAYTHEVAPQIARQEVERQGRIAELQASLEAHREIVKLRRPREERERQERIAKAQTALAEYDKELAAKLTEWEASQQSATRWQSLNSLEFGSSYAVRFTQEPNGAVFVSGRNAKGFYRVAAPVSLERVTGIRLEALADKRLPSGGPGRASSGNFVVTEFAARSLAADAPRKLVKNWDFSAATDDWQAEEGAKVVADSGTRYLIGTGRRAGIKTSLKAPAGPYLLEIVTGVRSGVTFTVQWTTASQTAFDRTRSVRRSLSAGDGSRAASPIELKADAELTGLRIVVQDNQVVLPIDAVRLFAAETGGYADIKLQKAQATFSQGGYAVETAIDGNTQADNGNGWAISPQTGQDQAAVFELAEALEAARGIVLELKLHQNYVDSQHTLGRFRISVTDAPPPLGFGLPTDVAAVIAKPADQRSESERDTLLAYVRKHDEQYNKLQAALTNEQQPLADDPRLKELEADLAKAEQSLPIDPKLQRLRRAVTLSEQQLKNKRLTVAQDIVWALINSPSFLYNH
jgi:WD40 repeat protein